MTTPKFFDHLGNPVELGPQLGRDGGEGRVLEVLGKPGLAAKIYHDPPPIDKQAKLRAMMSLPQKELTSVAAWPLATVHQSRGGPVRGFAMRKAGGFKEIHTLYSPAHRKAVFPQADWRFLVHTAKNCAAAFDAVHRNGLIVGDVNQSNLLVSNEGCIVFIDCDSFQVQLNGEMYPSGVGVPLFTPPELQGVSFSGLWRTANHDRFGLAVLIFHLLFMNRHPFSGCPVGTGEMPPIEKAIAEYRFAYGREALKHRIQAPPHTIPISAVSPQLVNLFERAFGSGSANADARPTAAEWFAALGVMLKSLGACPRDPGHVYGSHLQRCPWCELIEKGQPNLFVSVAIYRTDARQGPVFNLAELWARIEKVHRPTTSYSRPTSSLVPAPTPWPRALPTSPLAKPAIPQVLASPPDPPLAPLPPRLHVKVAMPITFLQKVVRVTTIGCGAGSVSIYSGSRVLAISCLIMTVVCSVIWLLLELRRRSTEQIANQDYEHENAQRHQMTRTHREVWERQQAEQQLKARQEYEEAIGRWTFQIAAARAEADRRHQAANEAKRRVDVAELQFAPLAVRLASDFDRKKGELQAHRDHHIDLAKQYTVERERLRAGACAEQLKAFLQQQFISDQKIPDIGPTRKAALASFGIETAYDVEAGRIRRVPDFGRKRTDTLIRWRRGVEAKFVFNAVAGVSPREKLALDARFAQARQQIESKLIIGERELNGIAMRAENELGVLYTHISSCLAQFAQANADVRVVPQEC